VYYQFHLIYHRTSRIRSILVPQIPQPRKAALLSIFCRDFPHRTPSSSPQLELEHCNNLFPPSTKRPDFQREQNMAQTPPPQQQPQGVPITSLPLQQLSQLQSRLSNELEHLSNSYTRLRAAQSRFKDCIRSIKDGIESKTPGSFPSRSACSNPSPLFFLQMISSRATHAKKKTPTPSPTHSPNTHPSRNSNN
jgi:hypothetical protein